MIPLLQAERASVFAANALQDVMKEVYEDSWPGSPEFSRHMDEIRVSNSRKAEWTNLRVVSVSHYNAAKYDPYSNVYS